MRPLGRVYGRSNLYRDMTDLADVDHREAKFTRLENTIKFIHTSIFSRTLHSEEGAWFIAEVSQCHCLSYLFTGRKPSLGRLPKRDSMTSW